MEVYNILDSNSRPLTPRTRRKMRRRNQRFAKTQRDAMLDLRQLQLGLLKLEINALVEAYKLQSRQLVRAKLTIESQNRLVYKLQEMELESQPPDRHQPVSCSDGQKFFQDAPEESKEAITLETLFDDASPKALKELSRPKAEDGQP